MASQIQICNMALRHAAVGTRISNLDTDRSAEAQALRDFYDIALRDVLREYAWPFAVKMQALALVEEDPNDEWAYSYSYPTDCQRFLRILSGLRNDARSTRVPYKFAYGEQGQIIYCDVEDAEAEYVMYVDDESRFSSDFVIAMSYKLAMLIAPSITGGDPGALMRKLDESYLISLSRARATAANEENPDEPPESDFINSRQ